jgi:hypothetical protein
MIPLFSFSFLKSKNTVLSLFNFLYVMVFIERERKEWVQTIDISQYRLLFGFSLQHTDRVPFELLDSAALL